MEAVRTLPATDEMKEKPDAMREKPDEMKEKPDEMKERSIWRIRI